MPNDVLIPVLTYPSVSEAVAWLTEAFGFTLRWQAGAHRAQVGVGLDAAIAIVAGNVTPSGDHVMVRVDDIARHHAHAAAAGASVGVVGAFPYGEHQYTAVDYAGRTWVFSQSVADVAPRDWGATTP